MRFTLALLLLISASPLASATPGWYESSGDSCVNICLAHGETPFTISHYRKAGSPADGNPIYLCSSNWTQDGDRPGYTLEPNWAHLCMIPYGGREVATRTYKCYCATGLPRAGK